MTKPTPAELDSLITQRIAEVMSRKTTAQSDAASLSMLTAAQMAALIDHTLLKPDATEAQIGQLCAEALQYQFASVCVNPTWVPVCAQLLASSPVKVCTVIGFPLGATLASVKAFEANEAITLGAREVDMVLNIGRLKSHHYGDVYNDIIGVVTGAHSKDVGVKVIIETSLLTDDEKVAACVLAQQAGADFVKTSTGFSGGGATIADVDLMRQVVGAQMGVKASGGIRTAADALKMVTAGATRIGASAGVGIVQEIAAGSPANDPERRTKDSY
jgi:deoxyribose-phosphate aldolase